MQGGQKLFKKETIPNENQGKTAKEAEQKRAHSGERITSTAGRSRILERLLESSGAQNELKGAEDAQKKKRVCWQCKKKQSQKQWSPSKANREQRKVRTLGPFSGPVV